MYGAILNYLGNGNEVEGPELATAEKVGPLVLYLYCGATEFGRLESP
jgi:hypothetical protein